MKSPATPRPHKHLGQNFLIDQNIVRKILRAVAIQDHETVFEIGPGHGALTQSLCEVSLQVIAVEIDKRLVACLSKFRHQYPNLELHEGNALEFPYAKLPNGTVVVANLPYYLSTPILLRLLEERERINRMALMLQSEVAKRLIAQPGSRNYGSLSVISQYCSTPCLIFAIPPTCFRPRPLVDSALVVFSFRGMQTCDKVFDQDFMNTVRAAFSHRRKTLMNSFKDAGWSKLNIHRALEVAKINPNQRAETLSVQEFINLTNAWRNECNP